MGYGYYWATVSGGQESYQVTGAPALEKDGSSVQRLGADVP